MYPIISHVGIFRPKYCQKLAFSVGNVRWTSLLGAKARTNYDNDMKSDRHSSNPMSFKDIPGPRGVPGIGTLQEYKCGPQQRFEIGNLQKSLRTRYEEYGSIMKETIGDLSAVRLFDPDYIQKVYQLEGKYPLIIPLLESSRKYREKRGMSPGLGNMNGKDWYDMRHATQRVMMRPTEVVDYLPFVNEVADDFIQRLKRERDSEGDIIKDFRNEAARWNLETAGMICFEKRCGHLMAGKDSHTQRLIDANNTIFDLSTKITFALPTEDISTLEKQHHAAEDYFYGTGQKELDDAISHIKRLVSEGKLKDGQYKFLSYLISRTNLDHRDISITGLTLLADGLNATVPALVFAMFLLAKTPDAQNKAFEEVRRHTAIDEPLTVDMLGRLTYLKACIKETFRFYPVNLDIKRLLDRDVVIGGYHIPAGTILELSPSVHLKSERYFREAERYMPERWMRENDDETHHPYIVIPFSFGPRMCIGRRIAEQDMYVVMTRLLQHFEISTPMDELGIHFQILQIPDRPVELVFKDRQT